VQAPGGKAVAAIQAPGGVVQAPGKAVQAPLSPVQKHVQAPIQKGTVAHMQSPVQKGAVQAPIKTARAFGRYH
jgi:hypothetical protein